MNPKPDPKIAEPSAGYAASLERAADPGAVPLTVQQQDFLREALVDFEELEEEAQEKSVPAPSPVAKEAALKFLHQAIREASIPYAFCMWEKGTVVVYAQVARKFRIDAFFDADGSASFHVSYPEDEGQEHREYARAEDMANEWVFSILHNMQG